VHPGEVLLTEILEPMNMTQVEFAERLAVPIQRINTIIRGKRGVTAETAILFARELGTTPEFWMNLQISFDLYEAEQKLNRAA
jgi:addiction module HigA family antidote